MITEDYVSFETAKLLKEKGFDELCHGYFRKDNPNDLVELAQAANWNDEPFFTSRPTLQMAMKWLRKEKGIAVIPIISSILDFEKFLWDVKIVVAKTGDSYSQGWVYEKQENACEAAIKYCLENLI